MLIRILQPFTAYPDDLTSRDFRPGEVLEIADDLGRLWRSKGLAALARKKGDPDPDPAPLDK